MVGCWEHLNLIDFVAISLVVASRVTCARCTTQEFCTDLGKAIAGVIVAHQKKRRHPPVDG